MFTTNYDKGLSHKPKTITIDTKFKEIYYQAQQTPIKESPSDLERRHVFWNYMMNVSMQNTVVQMAKRA